MDGWTIGARVKAICALLTILIAVCSAVGIFGVFKTGASFDSYVADSATNISQLAEIRALLLEYRGNSFAAAYPGADGENRAMQLQRIDLITERMPVLFSEYGARLASDSAERPYLDNTQQRVALLIEAAKKFRALASAGDYAGAAKHWNQVGSVVWPSARGALEQEVTLNQKRADQYVKEAKTSAHQTQILSWILLLSGIGSAAALSMLAIRSINKVLHKCSEGIHCSSDQVTSASSEVAVSSEQLAQGTSEQAALLEETSASSQEISSMTLRNAENSRSAAELMHAVDGRISEANNRLTQMVASMGEITTASGKIADIIKVIDEIAFQTNILALNAAVEAARAGEAGLGFAVVADEVRSLAQRSAQAAKDTTSLIEESVRSARQGSVRLDEVAGVIREITTSAVQVRTLVDEVNSAALEQARGVEQISRALAQMEQTTQQSAASAEEGASASQQLKAQASSMRDVVLALERLI